MGSVLCVHLESVRGEHHGGGLCEGKSLVYITTAGGFIGDKNFGYDYMCGVADMFGIPETELIKAEALDIEGFDAEKIMEKAIEEVKQRF